MTLQIWFFSAGLSRRIASKDGLLRGVEVGYLNPDDDQKNQDPGLLKKPSVYDWPDDFSFYIRPRKPVFKKDRSQNLPVNNRYFDWSWTWEQTSQRCLPRRIKTPCSNCRAPRHSSESNEKESGWKICSWVG